MLLVEDNADLARWVVNLMQVEHFTVDWAADGEQAETLLKTKSYDAVLLDLREEKPGAKLDDPEALLTRYMKEIEKVIDVVDSQ